MKTVSELEFLSWQAETMAAQHCGQGWLLDEQVYELHAAAAAEINNSGMPVQIRYLLEQGMTRQEIVALLEEGGND